MPQAFVSHFWTKSTTLSSPYLNISVAILACKTPSFADVGCHEYQVCFFGVWISIIDSQFKYLHCKWMLNQYQPRRYSEKQAVIPMSWFSLTMGKAGQGFLPPQTHPFSQHRPQDLSLHGQRQSHSHAVNHLSVYNSLGDSGEAYHTDLPS